MQKLFFLSVGILLFSLSSCASYRYRNSMGEYFMKNENFKWKQYPTKDFIMFCLPDSKADKNPEASISKIKKGIKKALQFTHTDSLAKKPVFHFVMDDRNSFLSLVKEPFSGMAYWTSNTIVEIYPLLGEAHEYFHLISIQKWGASKTWIMEGTAVYSDDNWNGKNLEKICLDLNKQGKLLPLSELFSNSKYKKNSTQITYPQSGSLVKFLINTYGWGKFIELWKKPKIEKVYHLTEKQLFDEWLKSILPKETKQNKILQQ